MRLFQTGGRRPSAKALYEVVPLIGGRDARIKSERLKKVRIKGVVDVRKARRHRETQAPRLGRPTEHQDTEARRQSGTRQKNHEANKIPRHRKNKKKSRVFWTEN